MISAYNKQSPAFGDRVFVAPNATVIGDVEAGDDVSIWFGAIVRGDVNSIHIGARTNLQDGVVCHVTFEKWALHIGEGVTAGHRAVLHGCRIGDYTLIGMGAIVLDGAEVGRNCIIAAGSVVREGMHIPEASLAAGVPATVRRILTPAEIEHLRASAERYVGYKNEYLARGIQHPALRSR